MKSSMLFLFALASALLTVHCKLEAKSPSFGKCELNEFTEELKEKGVALISDPETSDSACGSEWRKYGTCCETRSLKEYAKTQTEEIKIATDAVSAFVTYYYQFFDEAFDRAAELKHANSSLDPRKQNVINFLNKKSLSNFNQHINNEVNKNSTAQKFHECWDFVAKTRSNSLCSICSGGAKRFLVQNKIVITKELCSSMISRCGDSLLVIVRAFRSLGYFAEAMRKIFKDDQTISQQIESISKVSKKIEDLQILALLTRFIKKEASGQELDHLSSKICEHFLSIVRPTFISKLRKMLRFNKRFFDYLKDYLNHHANELNGLNANNSSSHPQAGPKASNSVKVRRKLLIRQRLEAFIDHAGIPILPILSNNGTLELEPSIETGLDMQKVVETIIEGDVIVSNGTISEVSIVTEFEHKEALLVGPVFP